MVFAKKKSLGKGLDALLSVEIESDISSSFESTSSKERLLELPIEWLQPGPYQPRCDMEPSKLEELSQSIRSQGIIQPIVVRPLSEKRYEIIAGERRWRASQIIPLETVPCLVKEVDYKSAALIALIENVQREDLNIIEQATALARLQQDFNLTHQAISETIGRSRSAVTNILRLNQLHDEVKKQIESGDLEMGHARALLTLTPEKQVQAGQLIAQKGLTVRETERLVSKLSPKKKVSPQASTEDANITALERKLSESLDARVSIQHYADGHGQMIIRYPDMATMDKIIHLIKGKY